MAVKEISKRELEKLVRVHLETAGINRSFGIHRLKKLNEKGCNWYLMAETADGWTRSDLILESSEDILDSIHVDLSFEYNLKPK